MAKSFGSRAFDKVSAGVIGAATMGAATGYVLWKNRDKIRSYAVSRYPELKTQLRSYAASRAGKKFFPFPLNIGFVRREAISLMKKAVESFRESQSRYSRAAESGGSGGRSRARAAAHDTQGPSQTAPKVAAGTVNPESGAETSGAPPGSTS